VSCPIDFPHWDNSAVDGYALRVADIAANPKGLPVSLRIAAGDVVQMLPPNSCARIFTGAPVPLGADTVIMQEDCAEKEGRVIVTHDITPNQNIRRQGEDLRVGDDVVTSGTRLRAMHIGLLASLGIAQVDVIRPLKVIILTTGNELVEPGSTLQSGQIYNSNAPLLNSLLETIGCEVIDSIHVPDSFKATQQALSAASERADCIISTGGVSVGDEDHVKAAVKSLGQLDVWKIAIKPGKPLAFGHINGIPFLGLPGNPAAVLVTFCIVVRPFLLRMMNVTNVLITGFKVPTLFSCKPLKRQEYMRVRIVHNEQGQAQLLAHAHQGSHMLSSACWADGLAIVPIDREIRVGDSLEFLSFAQLLS
jgi:molybdopterin molybdotransferase